MCVVIFRGFHGNSCNELFYDNKLLLANLLQYFFFNPCLSKRGGHRIFSDLLLPSIELQATANCGNILSSHFNEKKTHPGVGVR